MGKCATYLLFTLFTLALSACENPFAPKKTNWEVSLKKEDKKPYGSYLAYQSLQHYFPGAKIENLSSGFRYTNIDMGMMYNNENGPSVLVLLGLDFFISAAELEALVLFAENGNEIVLFSSRIDNLIENKLRCYKHNSGQESIKLSPVYDGKENKNVLALGNTNKRPHYGYEGRSLQSYFTIEEKDTTHILNSRGDGDSSLQSYISVEERSDNDTPDNINTTTTEADNIDVTEQENVSITTPDTLGFSGAMPNFIRYNIGEGHITLHAAPLVLSNYFLLQGGNRAYLDGIWQTLPTGIGKIYWNEYYKHRAEGSELNVLWRYPATRWALIIAIITLLVYVLFEGKRRQKIIPVVEQPVNTSVSFAETVGRLYYNKGNHANISGKMIQHFLDWVRTRYYLNTNQLNTEFVQQLAKKTGEPEQTVARLIEMIHEVRLGSITPDEAYLYELYSTIQRFYKNNNH